MWHFLPIRAESLRFRMDSTEGSSPSTVLTPRTAWLSTCSQEPCLWPVTNGCFLPHPFLQQRCNPFSQSVALAQVPRLYAKQYGRPSSSQGVQPTSFFGIGVRLSFFSFSKSCLDFFWLSPRVLFGSGSFEGLEGFGASGAAFATFLFGKGINIHRNSGPSMIVPVGISKGSSPAGPG